MSAKPMTAWQLATELASLPPDAVVGFGVYTGCDSPFIPVGSLRLVPCGSPGLRDGGECHARKKPGASGAPKTTCDIVELVPGRG